MMNGSNYTRQDDISSGNRAISLLPTPSTTFFFSSRRRHTRCLSDWSSDVCSSDLVQEGVDHLHRDVGPAGAERWAPAGDVVVVEEVRHLRTEPAGLRQYGRDETLGCALQQVPDEGAADAEAQHQELPDAQVIHQAELVVGVRVPGPVDLQRAGGLAAVGVAQVHRDAAVLVLELLDRVERRVTGEEGDGRVQPTAGDE